PGLGAAPRHLRGAGGPGPGTGLGMSTEEAGRAGARRRYPDPVTALPDHPPARREDPRMRTAEMAALRFSDLQEDDPTARGPSRPRLSTWQTALLVAAGGGVGAALRLIVTLSMPAVTTPTLVEVPWATLWVNLIGCLGLGALVG